MSISDSEIKRLLQSEKLVINPKPEDNQIQPASVDLRLSSDIILDLASYTKRTIPSEGIQLEPGDCALGSTVEWVEIPNFLTDRVEGKSSLGRNFLMVHVAGFIDPGFKGNITLELKNLGRFSLTLKPGMKISQLCFDYITGEVERPYGSDGLGSHYQNSVGTIGPR